MSSKKAKLFEFKNLIYDVLKLLSALPGFIYFRPKYIYESDKAKKRIRGAAIVVSNHTGFYDPVYLQFAVWYRRHHFVCLQKFFEGKAAWIFKSFLCIPIDKENVSLNSFRGIVEHLKNGEVVTLFPEGGINDGSGEMAQFKSGASLISFQSKAPIVPIYVEARKHWYKRLRFVIGEPIDDFCNTETKMNFGLIDNITEKLQNKENELKQLIEGRKK